MEEEEDVEVPRDGDASAANESVVEGGEEFDLGEQDGMDMPEMPEMDESGAHNQNENDDESNNNNANDDDSLAAPDDFDLSAVRERLQRDS